MRFHVTPPDIVERLRNLLKGDDLPIEDIEEAADEIERLREEVETWRDRYEAERQDHEATMKAWDAERSGL
jgi:predicted  nucleic acid-binding Zn-ribbon protein